MSEQVSLPFGTQSFFDGMFYNARGNAILVLNEEGIVLAANEGFLSQFHYKEEDIVGRSMRVLFTPEDQEKMLFEREIESVKTQGNGYDNNYLVNGNGVLTWVSGESILVRNDKGENHIVKVIQNIHEQKSLEHSLRNTSNFVESILRYIQDALVVINEEFTILKANDAFLEIFCKGNNKVEGSSLFDINPAFENNQGLKEKIWSVIETHQSFSDGDVEVEDAGGRKRYFKLNTSLINDIPGKGIQILIAAHENTAEKQLNQQREDLIGFASHELRNPLANMVLCTELLEDSLDENNFDEARDLLARTKSNIDRLHKIISELHDATKAGSGNLQIEKKPFDFEPMVNEAIDTVKLLHPAYNIILSGEAPVVVTADRYRLIQVLTNYLSNAIKYSFHTHDVWVHLKVENGQVITEVRDTGAGIAQEHLPFVFSRYFRADKTRNVEGLGLGLYLCSEIIRSHHGHVWVKSEEGTGSIFYFSIPVE